MTDLTGEQRARAFELAARGYGHEDIAVKLRINWRQHEAIRDIVLHRKTTKPRYLSQFNDARTRGATIRGRQLSSTSNRRAPITLAPVSILGDDQ